MNLIKCKFRRAAFRSFQAWYGENQHRFAMPLHLVEKTDRILSLSVGKIPSLVMAVTLNFQIGKMRGLSCAVDFFFGGECVDSMCWLDAYSQRHSAGVQCVECLREGKHSVFPSVELLWTDHIFEPLLAWINITLAKTERIEFCQDDDGAMSWINLITDKSIREEKDAIASFLLSFKQNDFGDGYVVPQF